MMLQTRPLSPLKNIGLSLLFAHAVVSGERMLHTLTGAVSTAGVSLLFKLLTIEAVIAN